MKLAIFDLGNVLFRVDFRQALAFLAQKTGIPARSLARRVSSGPEFEAFERGEISEIRFFGWLGPRLGVDVEMEVLVQGWNAIFGHVIGPAEAAIRKLARHLPVVALTNTNATHQSVWQMRYQDALGSFRSVYVSCELGMRKPERRIYTHVIDSWGILPQESVFFDDLEENIDAAAALGMATVLVNADTVVERWVDAYIRLNCTD